MKKIKLNTIKIRNECKRLGLTIEQLAKKINCTPRAVMYATKKQRASWGMLERIADLFDMDPKDLLK